MGCNTSKLDDEEAVQLCKDRKRFIKQAVEQRTRFDSGHLAYIQSLKRVSAALRDYVEGDEPREFLLDSFITSPFEPVKKTSHGFFSILPKSFSAAPIQSEPTLKVNYLKSGGSQSVSVEERHQSPETFRVETYSPMHHYGVDGFFAMQSSPMYSSFFSYSPNNRPNIPPHSPQNSQWDGFWNPFSLLDYYGYPNRSSLDQMLMDDGTRGLRQVREEEGIPDLEVETEQEDSDNKEKMAEERPTVAANYAREVLIEEEGGETDSEYRCEHEAEWPPQAGLQSQGSVIELSWSQNSGKVEVRNQEMAVGDAEAKAETPGFTVYVNQRPTSMAEIIKDLEDQFTVICNSAKEVSDLSESSTAHYSSASNDLTAMKMLNPVALLRTASSWSSSSRFLTSSLSSKDEECDSSSDFSEESSMFSGSHRSTLDKLFAWEKKLFQEVRHGERVRIACEKKCMQLRNQAVQGEDPSVLDKTRAAIRDLHTQIKVSLHSVEAVSKRIETLRDEELQPQLLELVQGFGRMWKVMAECHQSQKRTLDQAKLLLAGTPSKLEMKGNSSMTVADPQQLARSASNLETELRNWQACFEAWITSQRSYMHALTGWLLLCVRSDPDTSKLPFSPCRSSGIFPIFGLCIQWSKFLDEMQEMPVLDGLDFFAAGMGSIYAQQLRDDPHRVPIGSKRFGAGFSIESCRSMELLEVGEVEVVMTTERMAEVAIKVLCTGMSAAMSSLTEFAIGSAEGYAELAKQWENTKPSQSSSRAGA